MNAGANVPGFSEYKGALPYIWNYFPNTRGPLCIWCLDFHFRNEFMMQILGWQLSSDPLTQGSYTESSFSAKTQPFELILSILDRAEYWLQHK
jgi:hypothetical protein